MSRHPAGAASPSPAWSRSRVPNQDVVGWAGRGFPRLLFKLGEPKGRSVRASVRTAHLPVRVTVQVPDAAPTSTHDKVALRLAQCSFRVAGGRSRRHVTRPILARPSPSLLLVVRVLASCTYRPSPCRPGLGSRLPRRQGVARRLRVEFQRPGAVRVGRRG